MFPRFYLIVDNCSKLEEFLIVGVKLVQLRMKEMSPQQYKAQIRQAKQLCDQYNAQLIINDYWQLAIEEGCDYIHLGQEDLAAADMSMIKKANLKLGVSTHDKKELQIALKHSPDYIALGPIYATILKKMKWHPQGLEKLQRWKQRIGDIPLVAIGGFTTERAAGAFAHGADSVCVVTDVLLADDPVARCKEWLETTHYSVGSG